MPSPRTLQVITRQIAPQPTHAKTCECCRRPLPIGCMSLVFQASSSGEIFGSITQFTDLCILDTHCSPLCLKAQLLLPKTPVSTWFPGNSCGKARYDDPTHLACSGLRGKLPKEINLPASVTVPFGSFEEVLSQAANKQLKKDLDAAIKDIPAEKAEEALSKCRDLVMQVSTTATPYQHEAF